MYSSALLYHFSTAQYLPLIGKSFQISLPKSRIELPNVQGCDLPTGQAGATKDHQGTTAGNTIIILEI
jgi:hypothetical protein